MNAWAIRQGDIKPMHLEALKAADALFIKLPDWIDCHGAVKTFHECYPEFGRPVRGWWRNRAYEHSWIEFDEDSVVLDIYPIGQMRPLLIVVGYGTMGSLYTETPDDDCICRSFFERTGEHVEDCPVAHELNMTKLQSGDLVEVTKRLSTYHRVGSRVTVMTVSERGDFDLATEDDEKMPSMTYGFAYRPHIRIVKRKEEPE